jgi:hypothetical protein
MKRINNTPSSSGNIFREIHDYNAISMRNPLYYLYIEPLRKRTSTEDDMSIILNTKYPYMLLC